MKPFQMKLLLRREELIGRNAPRHPDVVEDRRLWLDYTQVIKPNVSIADSRGRYSAGIAQQKNFIIPLKRIL